MTAEIRFHAGNPAPGLYVFNASDFSFTAQDGAPGSPVFFLSDISACSPSQIQVITTLFSVPSTQAQSLIADADGIRSIALIVRFTDGGRALAVADGRTYELLRTALRALYTSRALHAVTIDRRSIRARMSGDVRDSAVEPGTDSRPAGVGMTAEVNAQRPARRFSGKRILLVLGVVMVAAGFVLAERYFVSHRLPEKNWYNRVYSALETSAALAQRHGGHPRALLREDRLGRLMIMLEYSAGPIPLSESVRLSSRASRIAADVIKQGDSLAPTFSSIAAEVCYQDTLFGNDCVNPHGRSIHDPQSGDVQWDQYPAATMAMQHLDILRRANADVHDVEELKSFIAMAETYIEAYPQALDQLAVAHALLARAYSRLRAFSQARYNANIAIALDPDDSVGFEAMAALMEDMYYYDRALEYIAAALERSPPDTVREQLLRSAERLRALAEPVPASRLVDAFMEDFEEFALKYSGKRFTITGELSVRPFASTDAPIAGIVLSAGPALLCLPRPVTPYQLENIDKHQAIVVGTVGRASGLRVELNDCEIVRTW